MIDHDYHIGDLVSYCDRPAIVTFVGCKSTAADIICLDADIICLDDYTVMSVDTQHLHYLGPGKQYLREAQTMARLYMLIEKLGDRE